MTAPSARGWVAGALALAALAALPTAAPAAASTPATASAASSSTSSFYRTPKRIPTRHGALIRSQRIRSGPAVLSAGRATYRVLFSARDVNGRRAVQSGLVTFPRGKAPKGGWKVISWAHGTVGTADVCAPSRTTSTSSFVGYVNYINPELNGWLAKGYVIARADYEGLGVAGPHPYLVGGSAGRSVLDVVRAARGLSRSVGRTFAIAGHSQGGHAALFAGSLAPRWTPELRLRGVASYAPASHVLEQAELLPALKTPSSLSALATLIVQGASAANAAVRPQDLLSAPALALYPQTNRLCLDKLGLASSLGGLAPSTLLRPGADLTALESVLATMNPAVRIGAPVLMLQGLADTTVFPNFTTQLDGELRAKGTNVTYTTFPGVNHGEVVVAGDPAATAFLTSRLGG